MKKVHILLLTLLLSCSTRNVEIFNSAKENIYNENIEYLNELKKRGVDDYVFIYQSSGHSIKYSCIIWREEQSTKIRLVKEGLILEDMAYLCFDSLLEYTELFHDQIKSDVTSPADNSIPSLGYSYISYSIKNKEFSYDLTLNEMNDPSLYAKEKVLFYNRICSCLFGNVLKDV